MTQSMTHDTISSCCTVCGDYPLNAKINFGLHPPANRFILSDLNPEEHFPLELGYCSHCGTIQLTKQMPRIAVKPRFSWLLYNEPEGHLDEAVTQIYRLPGIGVDTSVLGLTYKDQSTLERLGKRGIKQSSCLSYTIFQQLHECTQTPVDLLIARHIVEHVENAAQFILELKSLITPGGYLIIEIPDSEKLLKLGNHGFIWEEHLSYFTEHSLEILANQVGATIVWSARYSYPYEDSLMAAFQFINQRVNTSPPAPPERKRDNLIPKSDDLLDHFHKDLVEARAKWRRLLVNMRAQGHKLAVFGAGHLAVKWINFLQLADLLDCVIDDHSQKAGMFMPGSKLPILPSSALFERGIQICISTLSPESEQKVKVKLSKYFDEGGIFIHAFKTESHLYQKINEEVFTIQDPIVRLDRRAIEFVKEQAFHNARGRARICMHKNKEDNLHEMLIAIRSDSYIRPHRHRNKVESVHLVEGEADIILFNEEGQIIDLVKISPKHNFYYRLDLPYYHTVLVHSPILVIHETTNGPFNPKETEYAPFSPPEEENVVYIRHIKDSVEAQCF